MRVLAVETSCDETGASVVEKHGREESVHVLSNVVATSSEIHAKTGGIIPENAAREQVKAIIPVIVQTLIESENINSKTWEENFTAANKILKEKIDAIAVTCGPGLIGSLLVGVETAKALSFTFNKPLIPVHHLLAHIFANFIGSDKKAFGFPLIGLIVSGGHTDLLLFKSASKFKWLGGTRDDAAGEALDKIGRLLNLPYPSGPEIERRAKKFSESGIRNQKSRVKFKSPLIDSDDFDFSFSGLKAEAARFIEKQDLTDRLTNEICYALQIAIFDVLVKKTIRAAKMLNVDTILLGGGVSANNTLLSEFEQYIINNKLSMRIFSPEKKFATDNAAMIGAYAALNSKNKNWHKVSAEPELYFN